MPLVDESIKSTRVRRRINEGEWTKRVSIDPSLASTLQMRFPDIVERLSDGTVLRVDDDSTSVLISAWSENTVYYASNEVRYAVYATTMKMPLFEWKSVDITWYPMHNSEETHIFVDTSFLDVTCKYLKNNRFPDISMRVDIAFVDNVICKLGNVKQKSVCNNSALKEQSLTKWSEFKYTIEFKYTMSSKIQALAGDRVLSRAGTKTLVVVTGDRTYAEDVYNAASKGFRVQVWSWNISFMDTSFTSVAKCFSDGRVTLHSLESSLNFVPAYIPKNYTTLRWHTSANKKDCETSTSWRK